MNMYMDLGNTLGRMKKFMKESGVKIIYMEKERWQILMVTPTKESGRMVISMVMESILGNIYS